MSFDGRTANIQHACVKVPSQIVVGNYTLKADKKHEYSYLSGIYLVLNSYNPLHTIFFDEFSNNWKMIVSNGYQTFNPLVYMFPKIDITRISGTSIGEAGLTYYLNPFVNDESGYCSFINTYDNSYYHEQFKIYYNDDIDKWCLGNPGLSIKNFFYDCTTKDYADYYNDSNIRGTYSLVSSFTDNNLSKSYMTMHNAELKSGQIDTLSSILTFQIPSSTIISKTELSGMLNYNNYYVCDKLSSSPPNLDENTFLGYYSGSRSYSYSQSSPFVVGSIVLGDENDNIPYLIGTTEPFSDGQGICDEYSCIPPKLILSGLSVLNYFNYERETQLSAYWWMGTSLSGDTPYQLVQILKGYSTIYSSNISTPQYYSGNYVIISGTNHNPFEADYFWYSPSNYYYADYNSTLFRADKNNISFQLFVNPMCENPPQNLPSTINLVQKGIVGVNALEKKFGMKNIYRQLTEPFNYQQTQSFYIGNWLSPQTKWR